MGFVTSRLATIEKYEQHLRAKEAAQPQENEMSEFLSTTVYFPDVAAAHAKSDPLREQMEVIITEHNVWAVLVVRSNGALDAIRTTVQDWRHSIYLSMLHHDIPLGIFIPVIENDAVDFRIVVEFQPEAEIEADREGIGAVLAKQWSEYEAAVAKMMDLKKRQRAWVVGDVVEALDVVYGSHDDDGAVVEYTVTKINGEFVTLTGEGKTIRRKIKEWSGYPVVIIRCGIHPLTYILKGCYRVW